MLLLRFSLTIVRFVIAVPLFQYEQRRRYNSAQSSPVSNRVFPIRISWKPLRSIRWLTDIGFVTMLSTRTTTVLFRLFFSFRTAQIIQISSATHGCPISFVEGNQDMAFRALPRH